MKSREVMDYDFDDRFFDECIVIGEQEIVRRYEILKKNSGGVFVDTSIENFLDSLRFCDDYLKKLQESSKEKKKQHLGIEMLKKFIK